MHLVPFGCYLHVLHTSRLLILFASSLYQELFFKALLSGNFFTSSFSLRHCQSRYVTIPFGGSTTKHAQSADIRQPLRSEGLSRAQHVQRPVSDSPRRHPQSINMFSYSLSKGQLELELGHNGQTWGILTLLSSASPCLSAS